MGRGVTGTARNLKAEGDGGFFEAPREFPARRGFSVSYLGRTLLSRVDPIAQGERLASEAPVKERTLYFCPSPLYGYGLSPLLESLPENSAVLCVEADEKLFGFSARHIAEKAGASVTGNFPRLAFLRPASCESVCAFVTKTWGKRKFRAVEEIRLTGGWQLFPLVYEKLVSALRKEMAVEWGNAMTMIRLGRLYSKNFIQNLRLLPESADIRLLDFGSAPVLVLGAGPSLDPLLDELERRLPEKFRLPRGRRFRIICVDTCIPALYERGIKPDLVLVLESQHWNLRDFIGAAGWDVDAAIDLSALPASSRVLKGRRYFFSTPWTKLSVFGRLEKEGLLPETFPPLGSVGLSAVAVALAHSSGFVFTGGIDFSYSIDCYHARSTPGRIDLERKQNRFNSLLNSRAVFREGSFPVISKTGVTVRSDPAMRNYRALFEQEFSSNTRLLDIEGTGLPLGVKTVSAAEAASTLDEEGRPVMMPRKPCGFSGFQGEKIAGFLARENEKLVILKEMLSGERPPDTSRLEGLLDDCDYLWAHFPECAGAGGPETKAARPPCADIGFLKRVRAEIEPFMSYFALSRN